MPKVQLPPNAPDELREFVQNIPSPEVIRSRMTQNVQETRFLRRLLKIAVDAKRPDNSEVATCS